MAFSQNEHAAAGGSGAHLGLEPESAAGSPLRNDDEVEATQRTLEEGIFAPTQHEALPSTWVAPVRGVAACGAKPFMLNPGEVITVGAYGRGVRPAARTSRDDDAGAEAEAAVTPAAAECEMNEQRRTALTSPTPPPPSPCEPPAPASGCRVHRRQTMARRAGLTQPVRPSPTTARVARNKQLSPPRSGSVGAPAHQVEQQSTPGLRAGALSGRRSETSSYPRVMP